MGFDVFNCFAKLPQPPLHANLSLKLFPQIPIYNYAGLNFTAHPITIHKVKNIYSPYKFKPVPLISRRTASIRLSRAISSLLLVKMS